MMPKTLIFLFLAVAVFFSCRKEFTPQGALAAQDKYLVVDGVVNTGPDSTIIKLSTTKKFDTVIVVDPVAGAKLTVESDANATYPLQETAKGTYGGLLKLDVSHKYRLRINTTDGKEYLSDLVQAKNAPPVDTLTFTTLSDGLRIYANAHDPTNATRYYRYEYNEIWQFHSNLFSSYTAPTKYNCFGYNTSSSINITNTAKLSSDVVSQLPVAFVPQNSEKIEIKYSILVKQFALTPDAYSFWENLQKNSNKLGSIFDSQPSLNQTNYHNTANASEMVIGYLSVGSFSSKRIFITVAQLPKTYVTDNGLVCKIDTAFYFHAPYYYSNPPYASVDISGKFPGTIGIARSYNVQPEGPFGAPNYITYSRTECADCTTRGNQVTPSYWK